MNNRASWTLFHVRQDPMDAEKDAMRLRESGYRTLVRVGGMDRYGNGTPRWEVYGTVSKRRFERLSAEPEESGPTDAELEEIESLG